MPPVLFSKPWHFVSPQLWAQLWGKRWGVTEGKKLFSSTEAPILSGCRKRTSPFSDHRVCRVRSVSAVTMSFSFFQCQSLTVVVFPPPPPKYFREQIEIFTFYFINLFHVEIFSAVHTSPVIENNKENNNWHSPTAIQVKHQGKINLKWFEGYMFPN